MTRLPTLTDRQTLAIHRRRADSRSLFLHTGTRDEACERLNLVNREFGSVAVVTPYPQLWSPEWPKATIVRDSSVLALRKAAHDLVIHALALHWADDPVGQLIQCRQALQPDGLFLSATLGGQTLAGLRICLAQAESEISGGLSPRIAPMADLRDLGNLLQRAGFALPVADLVSLNVEYDSCFALMRDLRSMGENNALAGRLRHPTRRAVLERTAKLYEQRYPGSRKRIRAGFDIVWLTGWAPSKTQPKALRPGSAQTRLADALDTVETKLVD